MSLNKFLRAIADGKASVRRIGSVNVAKDANPHGVADAIKDRNLAVDLSQEGQQLFLVGQSDSAITRLCESIVLEDSLGNVWGLVSDLGNIAEIYRHQKEYDKAENIFVWLRVKVEQLAQKIPSDRPLPTDLSSSYEFRDYHLLYGQHTHGLALVYVQTGRQNLALELIPDILRAYEIAQDYDRLQTALHLDKWLREQIDTNPSSTS